MDPLTLVALGLIPILLAGRRKSSPVSKNLKSAPNLPTGKGLFVRSLSSVSKDEFLNDIRTLGLQWIAVQTHWQNDNKKTLIYLNDEYLKWLQEAKNKNPSLGIWFWAFPNTWNINEFVDLCEEYENYKMCSGYILDVEKPFLDQNAIASYFIDKIKSTLKKPVGLTAYGGGDVYIKSFPWVEFSNLDFGMPQIYDINLNLGSKYPKISYESWSKYFNKLIPIWLAAESHSVSDMKKISDSTPASIGYGWWDYKLIKDRPDVYNFIKTFKRITNA